MIRAPGSKVAQPIVWIWNLPEIVSPSIPAVDVGSSNDTVPAFPHPSVRNIQRTCAIPVLPEYLRNAAETTLMLMIEMITGMYVVLIENI